MIDVLLATYRAEDRWLKEQVDSILVQQGVEVNPMRHEDTEGLGPAASFSALLGESKSDYVAFADQDDVWLPKKLSVSLAKLRSLEAEFGRETPICVFCDSRLVDEKLKDLGRTNVEAQGVNVEQGLRFSRLLMQNFVPGHAMVFNAALREKAGMVPPDAMMHDVWLLLVAAAFGHIGYVHEPLVLYRQHGHNVLGARGGSRSVVAFRARLAESIRQAYAFVDRFGDDAPVAARVLASLPTMNWFSRRLALMRYGLWKHGWKRNLALLAFS